MNNDDNQKPSVRAAFTEKMVAALKEDRIPWRKPWSGQGSPHNAVTEKLYKGGNRMILAIEGMERGYTDPRYLTFNQARAAGGAVRKGEHATPIEYWESKPFYTRKDISLTANGKPVKVDSKREIVGDNVPVLGGGTIAKGSVTVEHNGKKYAWRQAEAGLNTLVAKTHYVFNVQQCDGLNFKPLATGAEIRPVDRGEQIAQGMAKTGVTIRHGAGGAFYQPGADAVSMPNRDTFHSVEGYYGTFLHELGHATGHTSRLNREGVTQGGLSNQFGSQGYAKEELVAEMTSAFIAMETGIPFDDDNHKAYIQSWAEALAKDENVLFKAAKDAGNAVDYMLDQERVLMLEHQAEQQQGAEKQPEVEVHVAEKAADRPISDWLKVVVISDKAKPIESKAAEQVETAVSGKSITLHYLNDPGHGWLQVPREIGQAVDAKTGVFNEISHYSYASPAAFYMEEDSDAHVFRQAAEKAGYKVNLGKDSHVEKAGCREMGSFNVDDARLKLEKGARVFAQTVDGGKWATIQGAPTSEQKKWVIGIEGTSDQYTVASNKFFNVLQSPARFEAAVKLRDGSVAEIAIESKKDIPAIQLGDRVRYTDFYAADHPWSVGVVEGVVMDAQATSTGNTRYRLATDQLAPQDNQPIEV